MAQYCPNCGTEMVYYYQNQSWYCHRCQRYANTYQQQYNYYQQPYYPVQQPYPYAQPYTQPYAQPYSQPAAQPYVQPAAQPAAYYPTAAALPDRDAARSKIYGAMKMRDTTDRIIPISWAVVMVFLQILVPLITVIMLYFWLVNGTINFSMPSSIAVVVGVFLADIAAVIVQSVLVYKLVKRRDEHFRRDGMLRQGMIEYLAAVSIAKKIDINVERWTVNSMHYSVVETDRGPLLWAMLTGLMTIIPIVGLIVLLYCLHFLTRDAQTHDRRQRDFNYQFQLGMLKTGEITAISYDWHPLPKRDTAAYVLLTAFTLGFALPYWWYVNIRDMNTHLQNQWDFEGQLTNMTREAKDEIPAQPEL